MKAMFRNSKRDIISNGQQPLLDGYVVFKKWLCFVIQRLADQYQHSGDNDSMNNDVDRELRRVFHQVY